MPQVLCFETKEEDENCVYQDILPFFAAGWWLYHGKLQFSPSFSFKVEEITKAATFGDYCSEILIFERKSFDTDSLLLNQVFLEVNSSFAKFWNQKKQELEKKKPQSKE
jgi:hypothetical protein